MNRPRSTLAALAALALAGCATWGHDEPMTRDLRYCNMMSLRADPLVGVPFVNMFSGIAYEDEKRREFFRCTRERGYVCKDATDLATCERVGAQS